MKTQCVPAVLSCVQSDRLAVEEIYNEISALEQEYPSFRYWFFDKVIPDCLNGTRQIIEARVSGRIAGVLIIKDSAEKKICTLRVCPEFRRMGIGRQLMECAITLLNTTVPTITVSDEHLEEFRSLFDSFGFRISEAHCDYYRAGHTEYVFNGTL